MSRSVSSELSSVGVSYVERLFTLTTLLLPATRLRSHNMKRIVLSTLAAGVLRVSNVLPSLWRKYNVTESVDVINVVLPFLYRLARFLRVDLSISRLPRVVAEPNLAQLCEVLFVTVLRCSDCAHLSILRHTQKHANRDVGVFINLTYFFFHVFPSFTVFVFVQIVYFGSFKFENLQSWRLPILGLTVFFSKMFTFNCWFLRFLFKNIQLRSFMRIFRV